MSSTTRELLAIEAGLHQLFSDVRHRLVVVGTDNVAAALAASSGRCGSARSDAIPVVRRLGRWLAHRRLHLTATWVPRAHNRVADAVADTDSLPAARAVFARARAEFTSMRAAARSVTRASRG